MTEKWKIGLSGIGIVDLVSMLLGYVVYKSLLGAATALVISLLLSFCLLLCLIPFVGIILYYFVGNWVASSILNLAGLQWSIAIGFPFIVYFGIGLAITALFSLIVLGALAK